MGLDMFKFLGVWVQIFLIAVVVFAIVFVGWGAVLDYRDWKKRPKRIKQQR